MEMELAEDAERKLRQIAELENERHETKRREKKRNEKKLKEKRRRLLNSYKADLLFESLDPSSEGDEAGNNSTDEAFSPNRGRNNLGISGQLLPKTIKLAEISVSKNDIKEELQLKSSPGTALYKGTCKGQRVAVKYIYPSPEIEITEKELTDFYKIRHPQLVSVLAISADSKQITLVREWMVGELCSLLSTIPYRPQDWELVSFGRDAAKALLWLHENHSVHLGLRSSSILYTDSFRVKLVPRLNNTGHGFHPNWEDDKDMLTRDFLLRQVYWAPELFHRGYSLEQDGSSTTATGTSTISSSNIQDEEWSEDSEDVKKYIVEQATRASDVYSFALCLWEILTGGVIYPKLNREIKKLKPEQLQDQTVLEPLYEQIGTGKELPKLSELRKHIRTQALAEKMGDLLQKCWNPNPQRRPKMRKVVDTLSDLSTVYGIDDPAGRDFWWRYFKDSASVDWGEFLSGLCKLTRVSVPALDDLSVLTRVSAGLRVKEEDKLNQQIIDDYKQTIGTDEDFCQFEEYVPTPRELLKSDKVNEYLLGDEWYCLKVVASSESKEKTHRSGRSVKADDWGKIVTCFGPLIGYSGGGFLKRLGAVVKEKWFHGNISGMLAEDRLREDPNLQRREGIFLVRFSANKEGAFSITFLKPGELKIAHARVDRTANGRFRFPDNPREYKNLNVLIAAKKLGLPCRGSEFHPETKRGTYIEPPINLDKGW